MLKTKKHGTEDSALILKIKQQKNEIEELKREKKILLSSANVQNKHTKYLELTHKIAVSTNFSTSVESAIKTCMASVCEFTGWELAHSYVLNEKTGILESSEQWHIENKLKYDEFQKITKETLLPEGKGLPGRVMLTKRPVWIENLVEDDNFLRGNKFINTKLKSGMAFPIMHGEKITTILEFFSSEHRECDQEILDIMVVVGLQLGRSLERKEAHDVFNTSNEQLMSILNMAPDAIITTDKNQYIEIFNPGAEKTFGYKAKDIIGKHINVLIPERFTGHHDKLVNKFNESDTLSQSMNDRTRVIGLRKDGAEFFAEASISKLILPSMLSYLVILRDISERIIQEGHLLEAKERAETANRAKSEFLANMSHELRTPLNAISGFSEIIKDQIFGDSGKNKYTEYAGNIFDSSKHLLNLINDILDLSAVESGEIKAERERTIPYQTINNCIRIIESRAKLKNISVKLEIKHKPESFINVDPVMLKQIIINLLSNAVKYSNNGAKITVYSQIEDDNNYLLKVIDTGIGIAEENVETVLSRFGKVGRSFKANGEGTGLGLTLCTDLAKLHGGSLKLESKIGVGTAVSVNLKLS